MGNKAVVSGGLETCMGQGRPWKSWIEGSSKAKPLETSPGTAEGPVASPQQLRRLLLRKSPASQGSCWLEMPRDASPPTPHCLQGA